MGRSGAGSARATEGIQWFQLRRSALQDTPSPLNAWTFVSVPVGFCAALERDIAQGPASVRAEALIEDLEDLFAWWSR
jgi:hypothetical protein